MAKLQNDIWFHSEGDNWFTRNKNILETRKDLAGFMLDLYDIKPRRVLEIGCSNGYRLASFHKKYGCEVIGVEPSVKAIADGKAKWPFIKFIRGMCETFELKGHVDLVIVNFVFHWIARENLIKSIERIDSVLGKNGFLLIGDFGTENFIKRGYHHLQDEDVYTYKQQYQQMFISSGLYKELAKISFNHDIGNLSADIDNSNVGTVNLLKKMEMYSESAPMILRGKRRQAEKK